jgi:hypothetical protein
MWASQHPLILSLQDEHSVSSTQVGSIEDVADDPVLQLQGSMESSSAVLHSDAAASIAVEGVLHSDAAASIAVEGVLHSDAAASIAVEGVLHSDAAASIPVGGICINRFSSLHDVEILPQSLLSFRPPSLQPQFISCSSTDGDHPVANGADIADEQGAVWSSTINVDEMSSADAAIERVEVSGVNDDGVEELDGNFETSFICVRPSESLTPDSGVIVVDDSESEADAEQLHQNLAVRMRARLKDASEHESRMRTTISSARRFALDLERTGRLLANFYTLHSCVRCLHQCSCRSSWAAPPVLEQMLQRLSPVSALLSAISSALVLEVEALLLLSKASLIQIPQPPPHPLPKQLPTDRSNLQSSVAYSCLRPPRPNPAL